MTTVVTPLASVNGSGAAPAVISGVPGLGNPVSVVLGTGYAYTGVQWYRNGSAISGATSSPYTQVAADIPAVGAANIVLTAQLTGLTYTPPGGLTNSNPAIAPAALTAPTINATPQVGVALSITAATFSGTAPITVVRTIYAGNTLVATAAGYTPVVGDIGKIFTVVDTASNGTAPNAAAMSANSAACIPAQASQQSGAINTYAVGTYP